jgi:pimeloyl-ACP methyl ester carboxylesterase
MRALLSLSLLAMLAAQTVTLEDRTIRIAGTSLHLRCGGVRTAGAPVVVLEAGGGAGADSWRPMHDSIARFARVCASDRPDSGTSGPTPDNLTALGYVDLMRDLLDKAGEPPPYVLVGHSFGGLVVSLFAVRHPSLVSGLVFVDSSHEDQFRRAATLPPPPPPPAAAIAAAPPPPPAGVRLRDFAEQLTRTPLRTTVPIVVLTAGREPGLGRDPGAEARRQLWLELQRDLASRSPKSEHIVAEKSGHIMQNDEPQLVIDAVRRVMSLP